MPTNMEQSWPTYHDLVRAYRDCRLHKPPSQSQILFEMKLGHNVNLLHSEILAGRYRPRPAKCFVVTHPKPREIFAADFRDRIIHHLLITQIEPIWERKFIYSSFACRLGKGPHGAIRYLQRRVREISQGGVKPVWVLQLDIAKFFISIDRPLLAKLLLKHCQHEGQRRLMSVVYNHDARIGVKRVGDLKSFRLIPPGKSWLDQEPNQGIPIGNLTSQFGANVYLNDLDHFIQRTIKPAEYLRYMDDLLLVDSDPERIRHRAEEINAWLIKNRFQSLNPSKTHFMNLSEGVTYLGYQLRQTESAKEPLQIFSEPKKKWQLIEALRELEKPKIPRNYRPHPLSFHVSESDDKAKLASINSRLGILLHSRSFLLRKYALERLGKATTINGDLPPEFADQWRTYRIKKGYRAVKLR